MLDQYKAEAAVSYAWLQNKAPEEKCRQELHPDPRYRLRDEQVMEQQKQKTKRLLPAQEWKIRERSTCFLSQPVQLHYSRGNLYNYQVPTKEVGFPALNWSPWSSQAALLSKSNTGRSKKESRKMACLRVTDMRERIGIGSFVNLVFE